MRLHRYICKVYYSVGQSETTKGCFIVKAFTRRQLYLRICGKQYDLQQELKKHVYIVQVVEA